MRISGVPLSQEQDREFRALLVWVRTAGGDPDKWSCFLNYNDVWLMRETLGTSVYIYVAGSDRVRMESHDGENSFWTWEGPRYSTKTCPVLFAMMKVMDGHDEARALDGDLVDDEEAKQRR